MFDRCVIINLDRRPDRWLRIRQNVRRIAWPLAIGVEPQRLAAFDGRDRPPPKMFGCTPGAWGCLQSHLMACAHAIRDGCESLLIFEDDAHFPTDFDRRVKRFLAAVPDAWDQLYLGGQHYLPLGRPRPINAEVLEGVCVLGTWAYAIRGRALRALADAIDRWPHCLSEKLFGVDRLWGALQVEGELTVYTPWKWCVHHAGGLSDTNNRTYRTHDFDMPDDVITELREQLTQKELQPC